MEKFILSEQALKEILVRYEGKITRATLHKAHLTVKHIIYSHIVRHIAQKSDFVSDVLSLCRVAQADELQSCQAFFVRGELRKK